MASVDFLQGEVYRLNSELQLASQEKIQAAEYGLAVLEEKRKLEEQYDDLENANESIKQELECLKEVHEQLKLEQQKRSKFGDDREESLVKESESREANFLHRIRDLENEFRQAKKSEKDGLLECDRLTNHISALLKEVEQLNQARKELHNEIRHLKYRESKHLQEYNELEDENINLQKQYSALKLSMVEFEALKVENKSFSDEIDAVQLQLQMACERRDQIQKQLNEALESLKEQRERNTVLQKELQESRQTPSFSSWEIESSVVAQINQENNRNNDDTESTSSEEVTSPLSPAPVLVEDLMKELQISEMKGLEEQLTKLASEKTQLSNELAKKNLDVVKLKQEFDALATIREAKLLCDSLDDDFDESDLNVSLENCVKINNQLKELEELRKVLKRYQTKDGKYQVQIRDFKNEIESLRSKLGAAHTKADEAIFLTKRTKELEEDVGNLKSKLTESEDIITGLQDDVKSMSDLAGEAQGSLNCTQDELRYVSNDLTKLYKHVCTANGETPRKLIAGNKAQENGDASGASKSTTPSPSSSPVNQKGVPEERQSPMGSENPNDAEERADPLSCYHLMSTVRDQVKFLKRAVEKTVEVSRQRALEYRTVVNDDRPPAPGEYDDSLRHQVVKLQGLLATKREQIQP
ncbi:hypothetical protein QZH41_014502 [Actinostola sp. cb2023]|nr:hypothetical protein QZH41_014502 [Actinostola sp. cb2023]